MRTKIAISGSHGSGKTSLIRRLCETISVDRSVSVVQEVAREMVIEAGDADFLRRTNTNFMRQLLAFSRQLEAEGRAEIEASDYILCDRCLVDHWVYTEVQFPSDCATPDGKLWRHVVERWMRTFQVVFLLPLEYGLESDSVREDDLEFQSLIDRRLRQSFEDMKIPVRLLSGSTEERLSLALSALNSRVETMPSAL